MSNNKVHKFNQRNQQGGLQTPKNEGPQKQTIIYKDFALWPK